MIQQLETVTLERCTHRQAPLADPRGSRLAFGAAFSLQSHRGAQVCWQHGAHLARLPLQIKPKPDV